MSTQYKELQNKILNLPKSDFPSYCRLPCNERKGSGCDEEQDPKVIDPPLLLLSLPPALKTSDLSSSQFFLSEDSGCRLINESKGITYDLFKVESSNAYAMFPPMKRAKTKDCRESNNETSVQGRLLREKNTFFMECTVPKSNLEMLISTYLADKFTYPLSRGISISHLSQRFKHSQKEVKHILDKIRAFPIPLDKMCDESKSIEKCYGILSEEIERDTWNVIVGVLTEWDGGIDYANKGVMLNEMVKIIMAKDIDMERDVVQYCLQQCTIHEGDRDNISLVKLNAEYIAQKLAHQLFNSRTAPWKQSHFLSEWYRLMPGVGKEYEPTIGLLKGIAIITTSISPLLQVDKENMTPDDDEQKEEPYWKYFPKESLPSTDAERFGAIFAEKEKWKLDVLKAYFDEANLETLLVRYARSFEDDEGSVWYTAK